jgi:hypothetical protein
MTHRVASVAGQRVPAATTARAVDGREAVVAQAGGRQAHGFVEVVRRLDGHFLHLFHDATTTNDSNNSSSSTRTQLSDRPAPQQPERAQATQKCKPR